MLGKIKIVAICGPAGSGKDWLLNTLVELSKGQLHPIISTTTRPIRQGEKEGVNYHYCTDEEFAQLVFSGQMLEATSFNGWYYGTCFKELNIEDTNIGVFNPDGIRALLGDQRIEVLVIEIKTKPKIRLLRQLNREDEPDVDEIIRRYKTDNSDFMSIDFETLPYTNNEDNDSDSPYEILSYLEDRYWLDKNV